MQQVKRQNRELQKLIEDKDLATKISQEYLRLEQQNERKVVKIKQERQLQAELDRIFKPYLLPEVG